MKTKLVAAECSLLVRLALALVSLTGFAQSTAPSSSSTVPEVYRKTRDQAGHELVKTEEFVVPVGAVVPIKELSFAGTSNILNPRDQIIVQQIFNCLEEITENTLSDPDAERVAEFKKMEFEVRGYIGDSVVSERDAALGERRAKAVVTLLTNLGTPAWRLHPLRVKRAASSSEKTKPGPHARIEFVRVK